MPLPDASGVLKAALAGASWRGIPAALASAVVAAAAFAFVQAASLGFGAAFRSWVSGPAPGLGWGLLPDVLAGWGVASLAVFGLGLAGLFCRPVLAAVAIAAAIPAVVRLRRGGFQFGSAIRAVRLGGPVAWISAVCLAVCALSLLVPETAIDCLLYHLAVPARALALGRLTDMRSDFLFCLPAGTEMLRGWNLAVGGEPSARLWTLAAVLAGARALFFAAGRGRAGWLAAGLWATSPFLTSLAQGGKPDLFTAPLMLAAFVFAVAPGGRGGTIALAGFLAGTAVAFKVAIAPAFAVMAVVLSGAWLLRRGPARGAAALGVFTAGALAAGLPWLARAWLMRGDPVFPFGVTAPEGVGIPAVALGACHSILNTIALAGTYDTLVEKLVFPWTMVMADSLPPFWLALAPLALMAGRCRPRALWLAGALGLAAWVAGPPQARYSLPALAWLAAAMVPALAGEGAAFPRLGAALAGVALALQAARSLVLLDTVGALPCAAGLESRRAYLSRTLSVYAGMCETVEALVPPGGRVLLAGENRCYPLARDFAVSSMCEAYAFQPAVRASTDPAGVAKRMRQLGVTHVVHNHLTALYSRGITGIHKWTLDDLSNWAGYWRANARTVQYPGAMDMKQGGYYVYRLGRGGGPAGVTPTLPGIEGPFAAVEDAGRAGDRWRAVRLVKALESSVGDFPEMDYFSGHFRKEIGDRDARFFLEKADSGGLMVPALWEELAELGEKEGRLREALAWRDKCMSRVPGLDPAPSIRLLRGLAAAAAKRGDSGEAEEYLGRVRELTPSGGEGTE